MTETESIHHSGAIFRSLTSAAKRDLGRIFSGWSGSEIRFGPYRQLLSLGLITGEQGWPLVITARGFDAYLARNIRP